MRKPLWIIGALTVLVVAFLVFARPRTNHEPVAEKPSPAAPATIALTGNIIKNNPGFKPDTWFLVYEQPGKPALTQELLFASSTVCETDCNLLEQGARVRAEGTMNGSVLLITHLQTLR